jgi:hypothetical protein
MRCQEVLFGNNETSWILWWVQHISVRGGARHWDHRVCCGVLRVVWGTYEPVGIFQEDVCMEWFLKCVKNTCIKRVTFGAVRRAWSMTLKKRPCMDQSQRPIMKKYDAFGTLLSNIAAETIHRCQRSLYLVWNHGVVTWHHKRDSYKGWLCAYVCRKAFAMCSKQLRYIQYRVGPPTINVHTIQGKPKNRKLPYSRLFIC